jgi:type VI secretion system protein ImpK
MRLIDCFVESLATTLNLVGQARAGHSPVFADVREQLLSQLSGVNGQGAQGGYSEQQIRHALFAVVAFIDEQLVGVTWDGQKDWSRQQLQREYFDTNNGGVEFFTRLDRLNPFNPAERDIREVYYYCLSLGFSGKFYGDGAQSALNRIRHDNYELLADGDSGDVLFADAFGEQRTMSQLKTSRDYSALLYGLPILVIIAAFFYFRKEILDLANFLVISV